MKVLSDEENADGQGAASFAALYQIMIDESVPGGKEEEEEDSGEEDNLEEGMINPMFIMVDEECMRSATSCTPSVWAVDTNLCSGETLAYPGQFKMAVEALVPKLYAVLLEYEPAEAWAARAEEEDGVWRGMGAFDADRQF